VVEILDRGLPNSDQNKSRFWGVKLPFVISVPCGLGRGSSKPDSSALYVRRIGERGPEGLHADRDQHVGGCALGVFDQIMNDGKHIDIEYYYKLIEKRLLEIVSQSTNR
jgi:hypothetical protein